MANEQGGKQDIKSQRVMKAKSEEMDTYQVQLRDEHTEKGRAPTGSRDTGLVAS